MVKGARSWLPSARGGQARTVRGVPGGSVSGVRPSCRARPGPGRSSTHSVPAVASSVVTGGASGAAGSASAGASGPVSWKMGMARPLQGPVRLPGARRRGGGVGLSSTMCTWGLAKRTSCTTPLTVTRWAVS